MSSIYVLEPPTNGRVILQTTVGPIDIELWSKEAPKACRNFVQLCLEGYYEGTIFHRVVKDFIAQGGDPTGTGEGGESVYGAPFGLELHSRLRFNRRGLVAMACLQPGRNASQFFFTLGATPELDKQNTIFGQVVGNSLFNMLRLGECETDQQERPLHPNRLISVQVVANPFDDVAPRPEQLQLREQQRQQEAADAASGGVANKQRRPAPKSEAKATKNFALLSFGDEAEEEELELARTTRTAASKKLLSSHDLLDDPRLSAETAPILPAAADTADDLATASAARPSVAATLAEDPEADASAPETRDARLARLKREVAKVRRALHKAGPAPAAVASAASAEAVVEFAIKETQSGNKRKSKEEDEAEERESEAAAISSAALKRKRRRRNGGDEDATAADAGEDAKAAREATTLRMLARFTSKMTSASGDEGHKSGEDGGGSGGGSLFSHVFQSDAAPAPRRVIDASLAAASASAEPERYDLDDPRNPMNRRRRDAAAAKMASAAGGVGGGRSRRDREDTR